MDQIEFEPLVTESAAMTPNPTTSRFGGFAAAVAVAATLVLAISAFAGIGRGTPPDRPVARAAAVLPAPGPADEFVEPARPTRFQSAYVSCMSDVGGSPDARERWVASCRREADQILHDDGVYAACMSSAGGAPDSMERHASECRRHAGIDGR